MATLKDLSEHTGYSIATISRILNNDPSMSASEATRQRVLQAAEELNYAATKSRKGRNMKATLHIGVIISCPYLQRQTSYEQLWLANIGQVCKEMKVSWSELHFDPNDPFAARGSELDGILAVGLFHNAQINWLFHLCKNVVFVDASPDEIHYDAVEANNLAGMTQAMEYLMNFGHENIGYLGPCHTQHSPERRLGSDVLYGLYQDAMRMYGFEPNHWALSAPVDTLETERVLDSYLSKSRELPTAILAATEENARGAISAFEHHGLQIPRDISMIAFSDIVLHWPEKPALTVVQLQADAMCKAAIRLIHERLPGRSPQGVRSVPKKVLIPPVLIRRQSVMDCRAPLLLEADSW